VVIHDCHSCLIAVSFCIHAYVHVKMVINKWACVYTNIVTVTLQLQLYFNHPADVRYSFHLQIQDFPMGDSLPPSSVLLK